MPSKRHRRNQTHKFFCPCCSRRLWRVGGTKHFIFYQGKSPIQKSFNLSAKKASFLAAQSPVCVDRQVWLEEFFCEKDGKIWLRLSKSEAGLECRPAIREDWTQTTSTIEPDRPNCSVSEFTYRMSRNSQAHFDRGYQ